MSITRQDIGFGTSVARNLADAHENAAKETVADALKRSLRTFGNQFGNSLYNKCRAKSNSRANQQQNLNAVQQPNSQQFNSTQTNFNQQQRTCL